MNGTISISQTRANLPDLVDRVSKYLERFFITVHGQPKAVIISQEELDSIEETAEILSIPGAREAIAAGTRQAMRGEGIPLPDFLKGKRSKSG
jgi:prevent-host-death family protein